MSDEAAEEKKEGEEGTKPKSKKMLFIIVGVVLVAVLGGVGAMMLGGKKEVKEEKPVEVEKHYATVQLPTLIVNLSDTSSYLKVALLLEYDPEVISRAEAAKLGAHGGGHGGGGSGGEAAKGAGGLPGPMAAREPMIKDAVIRVLSSKKAEELLTNEGKEKLKEELIEAINEASGLEEGAVVNIYYTEFIIQ